MTDNLPAPFRPVEGVSNFRDFGGYIGADGRQVRCGHLFRAANFGTLTPAGQAQLAALGVGLIIDLRRGPERLATPSQFGNLPLETITSSLGDGDGTTLSPHLQFIKEAELTPAATHAHMNRSYRRIPWEAQNLQLFAATFARLAEGAGPLVIHCAAGKDRTGILCGLILHALGVAHEDVMTDYLLTNHQHHHDPEQNQQRLRDYTALMARQFDKDIDPAALAPMVGVHGDFLNAAFDQMALTDGGINGYLARLGVDEARTSAIRARLLV